MKGLTPQQIFNEGGVFAYPTEAVFGLGCDPDNDNALRKLLLIKQRTAEKGLILLAGHYSQLLPYIDEAAIPEHKRIKHSLDWPVGITFIYPAQKNVSKLLTGKFNSIAVRITTQPDVVTLCSQVNKPIVSTSANLSQKTPAKFWQALDPLLVNELDFVIKGQTLGYSQPSKIIDVLTGDVIRS
ncbi:MAG: L-threonylcarbamoyladenylate synthase [Alteromonadaceae bacterium]|jgi:L-threonylcarbamoyladenylate synthase